MYTNETELNRVVIRDKLTGLIYQINETKETTPGSLSLFPDFILSPTDKDFNTRIWAKESIISSLNKGEFVKV